MTFEERQAIALKVGGYCMVPFILAIYFSTALAIALSAVLAVLWFASGQFSQLPQLLKDYPVALWALLLFACLLLGTHYGDAPRSDGIAMLKKDRELLFIPLLIPFLQQAHYRRWAWGAFMLASCITVIGSQLMYIDLFCINSQCLPYFKSYITHGILISFFAFFLMHKAIDSRGYRQALYLSILFACGYNLFFIGVGRTGQLILLLLTLLFALQRFNKKGVLVAALLLSVLVAGFVGFSDKAVRIKEGVATVRAKLHNSSAQGEYSMGERLTFWQYSAKMIAEKPLLGQGTGNFSQSYQRLSGKVANNPHNEFLLITAQLGILGLFCYLAFLASQYHYAKRLPNPDKWLAQGLLTTLVITSLFNSPFLDHTEGHWFSTLIALCFAVRTATTPPQELHDNIEQPARSLAQSGRFSARCFFSGCSS